MQLGEIVWVHGLASRSAGAESGDAAPCLLARALSPVVPREVPNMVRKADYIFLVNMFYVLILAVWDSF